ncbi:hypothetical protein QBC34DRAFT_192136 [Podospora aff. communis PSN243]|uniref:Uncharacterized protein n=1 Tax=Podospora aff. communis PSN243 TaxID=3040156 RepID=A0AAV9H477_9PEZI|nr:hypothetical protein QBC34DRAFT_192136 [Podospora aff. communis PSN243]
MQARRGPGASLLVPRSEWPTKTMRPASWQPDLIGQNRPGCKACSHLRARSLLLRSGALADMSKPCQATCKARTMMTACRGRRSRPRRRACVDSTVGQDKGLVARFDLQNSAEWASTDRAAADHWLRRWGGLPRHLRSGSPASETRQMSSAARNVDPTPASTESNRPRSDAHMERRPPKNRMSLMQCHDGRQLGRDGCTASRTGTWIFRGMCRVCVLTFYWFRAAQQSRVGFGRGVMQIRPPLRVMGRWPMV